jgi:antitoxin ParD1/3/4
MLSADLGLLVGPGHRSQRRPAAGGKVRAGVTRPASTWADFAKICHPDYLLVMSTMNISLPDALKSFVDEHVTKRGYATSSEYVRELIRADQDRERLRKLLLDGAASKSTAAVDEHYFSGLRNRVRQAKSK